MNQVKEVTQGRRAGISRNMEKNQTVIEHYYTLGVEAAIRKKPKDERRLLKSRISRMENCNRFWTTETYEASKVKVLLQTYLCHDKFCNNCKRVKQFVIAKRFKPYMEQYKQTLYHMTLTVPNCTGERLKETVKDMADSFKTLVAYLNGNKKISGLNLMDYGFLGCIRSLEITYKRDEYHPHYHVAAVFENAVVIENKTINNKFSLSSNRQFSEFEALLQRIWWLLINKQRLSYKNIVTHNAELDRYSCTIDKFQPDDYGNLFGYMTKFYKDEQENIEYSNFKALYHALERTRQIQGYGIFYNIKAAEDNPEITAQEYHDISDYLIEDDEPVTSYEPLNGLANNTSYTFLKKQRGNKKNIIK